MESVMTLSRDTIFGEKFTTYRIGGPLAWCEQPQNTQDCVSLLQKAQNLDKKITLLGWGGNTLLSSQGIAGLTLITRRMNQITALGSNRFEMAAGVHLAKAAVAAEKSGLTGGEFMIGIPGTIGGAIRMNAGAMGQEMAQVVECVTLYNLQSGNIECWEAHDLRFTYRASAINPLQHVVLSATLAFLPAEHPDQVSQRMQENIAFRKTHHPTEPNGGSVFRNPSKTQPAGMLLEQLGAKNWVQGGVRVSPQHANFIINIDHGRSSDVLRLMQRMQTAVYDTYGLHILPENLLLGDCTDEEVMLWQALKAHDSHV